MAQEVSSGGLERRDGRMGRAQRNLRAVKLVCGILHRGIHVFLLVRSHGRHTKSES